MAVVMGSTPAVPATAKAPAKSVSEVLASRTEVKQVLSILRTPRLGLADYHAMGEQFCRLEADGKVAGIKGWKADLAAVIGKSKSLIDKCLQLRKAYGPDAARLADLVDIGVGFGQLTTALAVADEHVRHELLRRAKQEGWGNEDLAGAIHATKGSRRGGGRPRRKNNRHGVVADLGRLTSLAKQCVDFHREVWSDGEEGYAAELACLPESSRQSVLTQLNDAESTLEEMASRYGLALAGVRELATKVAAGTPTAV